MATEDNAKTYIHGTTTTGFTKVTYGVEGGTRYEYFPPVFNGNPPSKPVVWFEPDPRRPMSVDDD